jgi:hypothetical protein
MKNGTVSHNVAWSLQMNGKGISKSKGPKGPALIPGQVMWDLWWTNDTGADFL